MVMVVVIMQIASLIKYGVFYPSKLEKIISGSVILLVIIKGWITIYRENSDIYNISVSYSKKYKKYIKHCNRMFDGPDNEVLQEDKDCLRPYNFEEFVYYYKDNYNLSPWRTPNKFAEFIDAL